MRPFKVRPTIITNRKWHAPCQMKWKSSTLDDLENHWQPVRSVFLTTAGLLFLVSCPSLLCSVVKLWINIDIFYFKCLLYYLHAQRDWKFQRPLHYTSRPTPKIQIVARPRRSRINGRQLINGSQGVAIWLHCVLSMLRRVCGLRI